MAITPTLFEEKHLPLVAAFAKQTWNRPFSNGYLFWRYVACPRQTGYLLLNEGQCLAMIWTTLKTYRAGGRAVEATEPFDWACLPHLRNSGLGIHLMIYVMNRAEYSVVAGGSEDTQKILPRLGWMQPGDVQRYFLPLKGGAVAEFLHEKSWLPRFLTAPAFDILLKAWFTGKKAAAVEGGAVSQTKPAGQDVYAGAAATVPVLDDAYVDWFLKAPPDAGRTFAQYFAVKGRLVGRILSRLYATDGGLEARIVDIVAPESEDTVFWMIGESVEFLKSQNAAAVFSATTFPALQKAFARRRFLNYGALPIFFWQKITATAFPSPLMIGLNTADAPILPHAASGA